MLTDSKAGTTFHIVDWVSSKQKLVSQSSYEAEILACSEADDCAFCLNHAVISISRNGRINHVLHVDSRGIFDTISTMHDGKEYRLRHTVQRIRESFPGGDIDRLRWIPSGRNIANGLTKRCPQVQHKISNVSLTGDLTIDECEVLELDTETCKRRVTTSIHR